MIQVIQNRINRQSFPDFFIVGPHRCGTSWLQNNIILHPQIFCPKQKELHFFCEHKHLRHPSCSASDDLSDYLSLFEQTPKQYLEKAGNVWQQYQELYWPKVKGEATACYATLDRETIEKIVTLKPNIKIILMVRDPIERAWSHAKLVLVRIEKKKLVDVSEEELDKLVFSQFIINGGYYTKMIETWKLYVEEKNFLIEFFDNIQSSPKELLLRVFSFLGVRQDSKYISPLAQQKINSVASNAIPDRYRERLAEIYSNEIEQLKQTFDLSW
jgi:Sulfotransferase domain